MYFVSCYAKKNDNHPCMILQYTKKHSAENRARKAMKNFESVTITKSDCVNAFEFGLQNY